MSSNARAWVGCAIMAASIALFFWWGYRFDIWGRRFTPDPGFLGLVGWSLVGAFGAGYAVRDARAGFNWAAVILAVVVSAVGVGVLGGHYH